MTSLYLCNWRWNGDEPQVFQMEDNINIFLKLSWVASIAWPDFGTAYSLLVSHNKEKYIENENKFEFWID